MDYDIDKIRKFAINKHNLPSDCQRYGNAPYAVHLEAVVNVFHQYKFYIDEKFHKDVETSCWFHDLIEDTNVNVRIIANMTNYTVADIVYRVSNERGMDRKERNFKTYLKIRFHDLAIFVKLCDRIANTRNSKRFGHKMFKVYKGEYPVFRYALNERGLFKKMWEELDELYDYKEE
jgi:(p)ppGpp synthase/HD superfamily hydrolase